jgi:anti-sigma regulatory factor (Ser/Thr protein kinase)
MHRFSTKHSTVIFPVSFGGRNLKECLGIVHRLVERQGFRDLTLDFGECTSVYESAMVPLITYLDFVRRIEKIDVDIFLPKYRKVAAIFVNSGWAHFLDPNHFEMTESRSDIHTQIASYKNSDEQTAVVDKLLSVFLNSMKIERDQLNAIEWSLGEITDNVLNHAGDGVAGYVQALKYSNNNIIEFIVADAGVGIPKSLGISDDNEALEKSIQQGVTRDRNTNQGNGLYGSFNIARVAGGQFNIQSYYGNLFLTDDGKVRYRRELVPYHELHPVRLTPA